MIPAVSFEKSNIQHWDRNSNAQKKNFINMAFRDRTETSLSGIYTVFYALSDQVGPRAVGAT